MAGLGTEDQDAKCDAAFNKLSEEFDGVDKITVQEKTLEQFRAEIVDAIFSAIRKETENSVVFMENTDYFNAKLSETKIEGLHKALGAVIDASTINVKE